MEGRKFSRICWAGNFQFRKRWLPSGTSQLAPLFRGQISEHFLPFSPVCWQVKGRIKLLPSKPLTWGSMAGPHYNIERNCEFKPKVTQRHGSTRFFLLSIRHKNLFRQLFHMHTITLGLSWGNFFYSGTYTLQTLTPWMFNLARALTKQMLLCIPSLFAFSSIKPNQCFLLKSIHPPGTQKSEAPSFPPCSASLQPHGGQNCTSSLCATSGGREKTPANTSMLNQFTQWSQQKCCDVSCLCQSALPKCSPLLWAHLSA